MTMKFTTKITISLSAIQHNFQQLCAYRPESTLVPVVKNDAYGGGARAVAAALEAAGATHLAVFTVAEAADLRKSGIRSQIWLLEGILPDNTELKQAATLGDARFAIWNIEQIKAMESAGKKYHKIFKCHLKIDTGMSRLGFLPREIDDILPVIKSCKHLELTGAFSHLALGDQPENPVTQRQLKIFNQAIAKLPPTCWELHFCATDGLVSRLAEELPFARPGIAIHGYGATKKSGLDLIPAMKFSSNIISVKTIPGKSTVSYGATYTANKPTRLAVIPVGYADGYLRDFANKASVLIHGQRAPIRGRICMGMFMADVTNIPDVMPGDEAVLLGTQGNECITAAELAKLADTIPYEILCLFGKCPNHEFA